MKISTPLFIRREENKMSKSLLVIDTPEKCVFCPVYNSDGIYPCKAIDIEETEDYDELTVPAWCPLKPMPTKYTSYVDAEDDSDEAIFEEIAENGERRGWNNCIDEILGDTNYER